MTGFFYSLLVVGLPIGAIVFFIVSLVRYLSGRKNSCETQEMKRRKILLVISSVIMGVLVASIIGRIALLYMAIAYM